MAEHKTIHAAMLAAQREFPAIVFNKEGQSSRTGRKYGYADLGEVISKLLPVFHEHGLYVTQTFIESSIGNATLVTTIHHAATGESLDSFLPMPSFQNLNWQDIGSGITYFKRYALAAMTLAVADEDDDAQSAHSAASRMPQDRRSQVEPVRRPAEPVRAARTDPAQPQRPSVALRLSEAQAKKLTGECIDASKSFGPGVIHGYAIANHALKQLGCETYNGREYTGMVQAVRGAPNFDDFRNAVQDFVEELRNPKMSNEDPGANEQPPPYTDQEAPF